MCWAHFTFHKNTEETAVIVLNFYETAIAIIIVKNIQKYIYIMGKLDVEHTS